MSRAVRVVGRELARWHPHLVAAGLTAAMASAAFVDPLRPLPLTLALALVASLGVRLWRRLWSPVSVETHWALTEDAKLGLLGVAGIYLLIQATGGSSSLLFPGTLLYLAAFAALSDRRSTNLMVLLSASIMELAVGWNSGHGGGWTSTLVHWAFMAAAFAGADLLPRWRGRLDERREELAQERRTEEAVALARNLGLVPGSSQGQDGVGPALPRPSIEAGVAALRAQLGEQLGILRRAFGLNTCLVYWEDPEVGALRVLEARSGAESFDDRPIATHDGLAGQVYTNGGAKRLSGQQTVTKWLRHYRGPEDVGAAIAVPIVEHDRTVGVLLGDRRSELQFSEQNLEVFQEAARLVLAMVQNERAFLDMAMRSREQAFFHAALKSLNKAQGIDEVHRAVIQAMTQVVSADMVALTMYDRDTRRHRVEAILGEERHVRSYRGAAFQSSEGLVANVVARCQTLPSGGRVGDRPPVIFRDDEPFPEFKSVLVVPIPSAGKGVMGTLVVASRKPDAFDDLLLARLDVLAHGAATSVANARNFERIRLMATTDGLTGLYNRRHFDEQLTRMLDRARRAERSFSVLLMDIDHFKKVNDTHGHSAGDEVLREVARRVSGSVRSVDVVARYGGEELVVLLEGTGLEAAAAKAELIRKEVGDTPIEADGERIPVTISIGVSAYPDHGESEQLLLSMADQALYAAKGGGRDQVRVAPRERHSAGRGIA